MSPKRSTRSENDRMKISLDNLLTIQPETDNQAEAFEAWKKDQLNLVMVGAAGTGKTFLGMYLALEQVMDMSTPYERLIIIRSVVPTRDVGHLKGTLEEKLQAYTAPYRAICDSLFNVKKAYDRLEHNEYITFESTSYIRGMTFDNCIILVDESQNCNEHELDSTITRVGVNTKIIFSGDYYQSDFRNNNEREGINKFLHVIEHMTSFATIQFGWEDCVRSDFVRDYLMTKEWLHDNTNKQ
jgi:phosphate starvation-inducible protein PhoH and related proteins